MPSANYAHFIAIPDDITVDQPCRDIRVREDSRRVLLAMPSTDRLQDILFKMSTVIEVKLTDGSGTTAWLILDH